MKIKELFEGYRSVMSLGKGSGKGSGNGPQWTIAELADEFGMSANKLTVMRKAFPGFPEPSLRHNANVAVSKRVYYDLALARKWFRDVKSKLGNDIKNLEAYLEKNNVEQ